MKEDNNENMAELTPPERGKTSEDTDQTAGSLPPPSPEEILQAKLEEAQKAVEATKDQFLRKAAEFENYKRRMETEFIQIVRNANEEILSSLIPILEDFARSFKSGKDQKDGEGFYKGVELIYQKLTKVLEQQGLLPFESLGKPFDVGYHDALLQVPRTDVPPGTVVEEVERGYMLHDRVLRHAKVIVSTTPADTENTDTGPADSGEAREASRV
jgi:molecular chaperone GrpE